MLDIADEKRRSDKKYFCGYLIDSIRFIHINELPPRRAFLRLDEVSEYDSVSYRGSEYSESGVYIDETKAKEFVSGLFRDPDYENPDDLAQTQLYVPDESYNQEGDYDSCFDDS